MWQFHCGNSEGSVGWAFHLWNN